MHSLEAEFRELHAEGIIDDALAARAAALDRGTVFSVFEELRVALYGSIALITAGLGILLKKNLDRIGPITVIVALAVVAAACYASAIRTCRRRETRSLPGDYILLLGALVMSADLGYAEVSFHWLGSHWSWHLLLLAAIHALTAYALDSRLVLSVAVTSLAAWFGFAGHIQDVVDPQRMTLRTAQQALLCAATVLGWREIDRRLREAPAFREVLEHFGLNFAFWGALAWCAEAAMRAPGLILLAALAVFVIRRGLRSSQEILVVYGVVYAALGVAWVLGQTIAYPLACAASILITVVAAIVALWQLHSRIAERAP